MKTFLKKFFTLVLVTGCLFSPLTISATELQNNTTHKQEQTNNQTNNNSNSPAGQVGNDAKELANEVDKSNKTFTDALTGMMGDMAAADDGILAKKTSQTMAKLWSIPAQICRGGIILALLTLGGFDLLCLAIPGLEPFFAGSNRNSSSGGLEGGSSSSNGKSIWLTEDYFAVAGGHGNSSSGGGGLEGGSSNNNTKNQNKFVQYISLHLKTLVFAGIAIIIFASPLGLAIVTKLISWILLAFSAILKGLGGVL